jgi:RNA polymerase primary sigma factor
MEQNLKSKVSEVYDDELARQGENAAETQAGDSARNSAADLLGRGAVQAVGEEGTDEQDVPTGEEVLPKASSAVGSSNEPKRPAPPRDNTWRQSQRKLPSRTDYSKEPRPVTSEITDGVKLFFQEASKCPLLTAAEEVELAKRIERGDMEAKDRMITSNLRLVIHVARGYRGQGLPFEDLIQEGIVGLIRAAEKFDWRKGFKFSTYATLWLRQAIQRGLANTGNAIRLPAHIGQRERKVARVEKELTVRLGREPTIDELAAEIDDEKLGVDEINDVRTLPEVSASLDQPIGGDGETTFGSLFEDQRQSVQDEVEEEDGNGIISTALDELPEKERSVIELRYGFGKEKPLALREAGAKLGMSAERVRQIEERAIRILQDKRELQALRDAA